MNPTFLAFMRLTVLFCALHAPSAAELRAQAPSSRDVLVVRVVDQTRHPLPDATVIVRSLDRISFSAAAVDPENWQPLPPSFRSEGKSDADGVVTFKGLPQSRLEVFARAPGYRLERWVEEEYGVGRHRGVVELRLRKATMRTGTLHDHKGRTIEGVRIRYATAEPFESWVGPELALECDESGAFRYVGEAGLVSSDALDLRLPGDIEINYVSAGLVHETPAITLPRLFPFRGEVQDAITGKGVAGAEVRLRMSEKVGEAPRFMATVNTTFTAVTGDDGSYRIDLPRDVLLRVMIDHPDFMEFSTREPSLLTSSKAQKAKIETFALERAITIRGRVTQTDKATAIPRALVVGFDHRAWRVEAARSFPWTWTDEKGDFALRLRDRKKIEIMAWHPEFVDDAPIGTGGVVDFDPEKPPAGDLELSLCAPVWIEGVVLDNKRNPVPGAVLTLANLKERWLRFNYYGQSSGACAVSNPDGRFRIRCHPTLEESLVEARHQDFAGLGRSVVHLSRLTKKPVPVRIQDGVEVSGRVVDESGAPVTGFAVFMEKTEDSGLPFHVGRSHWDVALTDSEGRFRFRQSAAGPTRLTTTPGFEVNLRILQGNDPHEILESPKLEFLPSPGETRELELRVRLAEDG